MNIKTLSTTTDGDGRPWVEVYLGATYSIVSGVCQPEAGGYELIERSIDYKDIQYPGRYRPPLLRRDADLQPRRHGTDVVIQGVWRSDARVRTALCTLTCRGAAAFRQEIILTGDRHVERGRSGWRFSEPELFSEMPIRYDRAYGGTDERTALRHPDPYEEALRGLLSEEAFYSSSTYSYPRNPAGRGYVVDEESLDGTPLPNLEWPDRLLALDHMVVSLDRWDERPTPAAFDWYGHGWFPRVAFADDFEPTLDDRTPAAEVALGIIPANLRQIPLIERPSDAFFQGANPRLWRRRLRGDEAIEVTGMSPDGHDNAIALPGLVPQVSARIEGQAEVRAAGILDVVFIETEFQRLTLVWRARLPAGDPMLRHRPSLRADLTVEWRQV